MSTAITPGTRVHERHDLGGGDRLAEIARVEAECREQRRRDAGLHVVEAIARIDRDRRAKAEIALGIGERR